MFDQLSAHLRKRPTRRRRRHLSLTVLTTIMLVGMLGCSVNVLPPAGESNPANLVPDGTFASLSAWYFAIDPSAKAAFTQDQSTTLNGQPSLHVRVDTPTTSSPWLIQARQSGIQLRQSQHLYLSFYAKGDAGGVLDTSVLPRSSLNTQNPVFATFYAFYQVALTPTWSRYVMDVIPFASDDNATLAFSVGDAPGNIWLNDVNLSAQQPAGLQWTPSTALAQGVATGTATPDKAPSLDGWKLIWNDEFTGNHVDTSKWNIASNDFFGYQNTSLPHAQYWTPNALSVANGDLRIVSRAQSIGGYDYTSGAITSENKFSFTYGRVDIRAKLPYGNGLWTVFWLLNVPYTRGYVKKTEATQEIDMMEYLGQSPSKPYFVHHYGTTGDEWCVYRGEDLSKNFHVYTLEWSASALDEFVDGVHRCRVSSKVPTVPMYLLINTAVGGDFPVPADSTTPFPQYTDIDYVRVYQPAK